MTETPFVEIIVAPSHKIYLSQRRRRFWPGEVLSVPASEAMSFVRMGFATLVPEGGGTACTEN